MNSSAVVILTALNLEYEAVRSRLTRLHVHWHPAGTRFEVGRLVEEGRCRVVLGLVGKGNHPAAVIAERAMTEFSPIAMLFVGIAGALRPRLRLGDVVVASHVYAYHGGTSEDDGLKARPRVWEIAHDAGQIAQHVARGREWCRDLTGGAAPKVHFGPIAAGEVLQDSAISEQAQWVRLHYHDALAIEMEAAGVAQAGHLHHALPVVVVRGISDRADGTKQATDSGDWQPQAATHAAAFATTLAEELVAAGVSGHAERKRKDGPTSMDITNLATGNAQVGVQAGQIYGGISFGSPTGAPPADLAGEVTALRQLLKQALRDGLLDRLTYQAAEAELDVVSDCLKGEAPGSRSTLTVTLKKLRGLVADLGEISAKLTVISAAVRGLP